MERGQARKFCWATLKIPPEEKGGRKLFETKLLRNGSARTKGRHYFPDDNAFETAVSCLLLGNGGIVPQAEEYIRLSTPLRVICMVGLEKVGGQKDPTERIRDRRGTCDPDTPRDA